MAAGNVQSPLVPNAAAAAAAAAAASTEVQQSGVEQFDIGDGLMDEAETGPIDLGKREDETVEQHSERVTRLA